MKRRRFLAETLFGFLSGSTLVFKGCAKSCDYDLLIRNGEVYDGTGAPGRKADIAVKGDRIVAVGKAVSPKKAKTVIDADGLAVAPGFIDAHSHTDVQLLINPRAESKIRQGVTTEIAGNCGYSLFPFSDTTFEKYRDSLTREFGFDLSWKDIHGFFARLKRTGTALNYATLLGHGNLRETIAGPNDRQPDGAELALMKQAVSGHIKAGAFGLSTGLEYTPGCFAATEELTFLCREAAAVGGIYTTHLRSEQDGILEALDEAFTITAQTGIRLQISHLKVNYKQNWPLMDKVLSQLDTAARKGVTVMADCYPYRASATGLSGFFPAWAREGTPDDFCTRLKDPLLDGKLSAYVKEQEALMESWDNVLISSVFSDTNKYLEGKTILQAAAEIGKVPYDFMRDLLIAEKGWVGIIKFAMSEENVKKILSHPMVVIGSDGNAVAPYGALANDKPHPRFYGTFPRVLGRYVREEKILTLTEAVRKMTSLTAEQFNLPGRGRLEKRYFADITVFDPDTVTDMATFEQPHQYPTGIQYVIVNGRIVIREGEHTGELPGRILKKGAV